MTLIIKNIELFSKTFWKQRYLMIMVIPVVVWMLIFNYKPMYGIIIAFQQYDVFLGFSKSPWIGLDNFKEVFTDAYFLHSLVNTLKISILKLLLGFPLPIIFAILLNEITQIRFKKLVQTVSYLPYFISWAFVVSFMYTLFSPSSGVVNSVLMQLHIIHEPIFFMGEPKPYLWLVVGSEVWKNMGWNSIIYIAAITSIDIQMYEASIIDGANRFQRIWHITLPAIKPTVVILLIFSISGLIGQNFEQLFLMNSALTQEVGEIIDTYTYRLGMGLGRFSYATAVGLFKSVTSAVLLLTANFAARRLTDDSLF